MSTARICYTCVTLGAITDDAGVNESLCVFPFSAAIDEPKICVSNVLLSYHSVRDAGVKHIDRCLGRGVSEPSHELSSIEGLNDLAVSIVAHIVTNSRNQGMIVRLQIHIFILRLNV